MCVESFEPNYFSLMPIHFWSPEGQWHHLGVRTPCVIHGWAHAQYTRLGVWRQRRTKGRVTDICVAGQRILGAAALARAAHEVYKFE